MPDLRIAPFALALILSLSACQSSEEKAEGYFQSGMSLLAQGDEDRALVEFRNVFKYNGFHKEARQAYADVLYKRGNLKEAYGQYLRLIEQYPDTVEVRQNLAEMAMGLGNWDEVERHGRAALRLAPDQPGIKALGLALDYRAAVLARDETTRTEVADKAKDLLQTLPDSLVLRRILIDRATNSDDPSTALPEIDAALNLDPKSFEFHNTKLRILAQANDLEGIGAQLKIMVELFPESQELKASLVRWYLSQKDLDGAEAFLRKEAGPLDAAPEGHIAVVQMLNAVRSRDAGRDELKKLIEANKGTANADLYGSFLATLEFEEGRTEEAIAALESLIATAEVSDQTRRIQTMLARMLDQTGKRTLATPIIATVLEQDPSNVEALKLRATWRIAEDRPGEAIIDLRAAQNQAPRDPQIMTLMAAAHERDGSKDLAGEQLAKAVEASGSAPEESVRYALFLRQQGRPEVAVRVLIDARRVSPGNADVLIRLADIYLATNKWSEVGEIAETLRGFNTPQTLDAAQRLQAAILLGQNRIDEGIALLENGANTTDGDIRATTVVVQTQVRAGRFDEAKEFLKEAREKNPDDISLELLAANLDALTGNVDLAEAGYRSVMSKQPKAEVPVRLLYGLLLGANRPEDASSVLDAGLTEMPNNPMLLWMKAGILEREKDIDGAIGVYEKLYLANSSDVIAANNLASLITTYRDDPESLERAFAIARRLRDAEEPAFQDTYGWIEYRRGNVEEALKYLEPAAKGLTEDPLAQFHLGMAYADLGRKEEAIAQFTLMIDLAKNRDLPQLAIAQDRLKALQASP